MKASDTACGVLRPLTLAAAAIVYAAVPSFPFSPHQSALLSCYYYDAQCPPRRHRPNALHDNIIARQRLRRPPRPRGVWTTMTTKTMMISAERDDDDYDLNNSDDVEYQVEDKVDEVDIEKEVELSKKFFSTLRTIGIDYGLSRTGIAVTTGGYRPRPLAILSSNLDNNSTDANPRRSSLSSAIVDLAVSERATNVVLGLPLHKNGTESEQSSITREFGRALLVEVRRRCGPNVKVNLWDERYTSKEAASRIRADAMARGLRAPSASDLETELDADAACIILEDYYRELGLDAEVLELDDDALAQECEVAYRENLEREESRRVERMEERERGRNARRDMIERARALEEEQGGGAVFAPGKKKKKKKKKR